MILSDDEINLLVREASRNSAIRRDGTTSQRIARAIEAKVLEKLSDEYAMRLQSDLEHGVKSLNIAAHEKFNREYPQLAGFLGWLDEKESKCAT